MLISKIAKYLFPMLLLLPALCVVLSGKHEWIGRLVGSLFFIVILIVFAIWAIFAPYQKLMGKHAKLTQPHYKKARKIVLPILRLIFTVLAVGIFWFHLIPFTIDISLLIKGEKPLVVEGTVSSIVVPFPLLEFISQEIALKNDGHTNSYRFYYSLRPRLKRESRYELIYLKHSKIVLEAWEMEKTKMTKVQRSQKTDEKKE